MKKSEEIARLICRWRGADPDQPLIVGLPVDAKGRPLDGDGNVLFRKDAKGKPAQRRDEATGEPVFEEVENPETGEVALAPVYLTAPPTETFDQGWKAYEQLAERILKIAKRG
jgi:hypothetical protein